MRLTIDGADVELPLHQFVDFNGEAVTSGTLVGAPVRDFNVMSRRSRVNHHRGCKVLVTGEMWPMEGNGAQFIHLVEGAATAIGADAEHRIERGGSLLVAGGTSASLRADSDRIEFVWASFTAVA
jgi:environmental stress-induced protein Ves